MALAKDKIIVELSAADRELLKSIARSLQIAHPEENVGMDAIHDRKEP